MRKVQLYIVSLWLFFFLVAVKEAVIITCNTGFTLQCIEHIAYGNRIPIIALTFMLLGLFFYWRFTYILKGSTKLPKEIKKIENENYEHLTFLTTYVIPFLGTTYAGRDLLLTFLLLLIIGAIFVKTNLFYKNPTLALLGYKLYKVDTEMSNNIIFISRENLKLGDKVRHIHLSDNVYFVKK